MTQGATMRQSTELIMRAAAAVQYARGAVTYQAQVAARAIRDAAPDARLELAALRDLQTAHRDAQLHLDALDPSGAEFGPIRCALCGSRLTGDACARCLERCGRPRRLAWGRDRQVVERETRPAVLA
jgi:hypothetical protein